MDKKRVKKSRVNSFTGIISEPLVGIYRIPPKKAEGYDEIMRKAINKALQQDWFSDFDAFDDSPFPLRFAEQQIRYRSKNGLCVRFLNGSYNDILFNPGFAKAIGYKLADLGAWCDLGNDPMEYVEQFLD